MNGISAESIVNQIADEGKNAKGWMKFLGVITIISGIGYALTIVGILVAWIPIWMGILLLQAGNKVDEATIRNNPTALVEMMAKIRVFFTIQAILLIVSIAGIIFLFLVAGISIFSLGSLINSIY